MKLSLLLLSTFLLQPLLFSMELSEITPKTVQAKNKKKKSVPVDIKTLCGYSPSMKSEEYLKTLQKAANGFLIQDTFINQIQGYVQSEEHCQKISKSSFILKGETVVSGFKEPLDFCYLSMKTPEAVAAVIRNSSLFMSVFSNVKPPSQPENESVYELAHSNLTAQNNEHTQRFIEQYKYSANKEIKRMAQTFQYNMNMKQATKINETNVSNLFNSMREIGKSYNSIFSKQNTKLNEFLIGLKCGVECINQYTANLLEESSREGFNVADDENLHTYIRNLKVLVQKYQENKDKFNKYYGELYKEIKSTIDIERKADNKNVKVLAYLKKFNVETGSPDTAVLPESLLRDESNALARGENQEWLPDLLKQKTSSAKQKKKNKKQFLPLQESKEKFHQKEDLIDNVCEEEEQEFVDESNKETEDYITINDVKNNVVIKLFKTDTENQLTISGKPSYTPWVTRWLTDPLSALQKQGYTDPENKKYTIDSERTKTILVHGFSPDVDTYVQQWGKQATTPSRQMGEKGSSYYPSWCDYLSR